MPNYMWYCVECEDEDEKNVPSKLRDTFEFPCDECGTARIRRFGMPMIMTASYPDGTKRSGWADMKASAKLEEAKASLNHRSADVKAINKELDEREAKSKTSR